MKNLMEYNGYSAKVEYSDEDKCYFGIIMDIDDSVSFEGKSIDELSIAFHNAVDDYIKVRERLNNESGYSENQQ